MRFAFLTLGYHPDLDGGGYRYATEVAERLADRGHEVHVVFPNPENRLAQQETRRGVHLHRVAGGKSLFFANHRAKNAAARTELNRLLGPGAAPTLVATHQAYFRWAAQPWPTVFMFQGPWGLEYAFSQQARPRGILRRWMDPWISRRMHASEGKALGKAPRILVASDYTRRQLPKWHPRVQSPVEVVSGGANFGQFAPLPDRNSARTAAGLRADDFVFLTARRLDPRMGLLGLLDAFSRVAQEFPKARLWLAGRGPQKAQLESAIAAAGLADRAKLLGYVPEADLARVYGLADVTLMPSLDLEGFGLATVESLACGTPVLASDAGANPELVGALEPALLYRAGDNAALAAKLRAILDGTLRLPNRQQCADFARHAFPWNRPVDSFERAWHDCAVKP